MHYHFVVDVEVVSQGVIFCLAYDGVRITLVVLLRSEALRDVSRGRGGQVCLPGGGSQGVICIFLSAR